MDIRDYRAWLERWTRTTPPAGVTMTEPVTTPAKTAATRDQLWPELVTAAGAWRKHYHRCPPGHRCRREHMEWLDMLLDEYLDATT